jgi:integrase
MRAALQVAGISGYYRLRAALVPRIHDARHTAATDLLLLGVHERTIMSVLGWSTTAMASRYTHVITSIHSDLPSRLNGLLWSSRDAPIGTN